MTRSDTTGKTRFLVLHDYGMGGLWWWIRARSAREVLETFAEVEVVDDAETVARAGSWDLGEADVDGATVPDDLAGLRARRDAQRERPGFGALADRSVVHLRLRYDEDADPAVYLVEVGPDGRRLRQVELGEDGTAVKSGPDDWPFNPPLVDLFDPDLPGREISQDEFEAAWLRARPESGDQ
ncbi:hypothetical protein [Streptomyces sp. NPDC048002]|uniref:hypothetical protein n=1 Tax=unclassified Streptomyces TaxID=2593676 RepID=UPI0033E765E3